MSESVTPYWEIAGLETVYLEDSWVLEIAERESEFFFVLDLVLREDHPEYMPPKPDEAYCYRRGRLRFPDAARVEWKEISTRAGTASPVDGEVDYGNIDEFLSTGSGYRLAGSWGVVVIESQPPIVELI